MAFVGQTTNERSGRRDWVLWGWNPGGLDESKMKMVVAQYEIRDPGLMDALKLEPSKTVLMWHPRFDQRKHIVRLLLEFDRLNGITIRLRQILQIWEVVNDD